MYCFEGAQFIKSVVKWGDLPPEGTREVAFVGRSNAGKSSALNVLANRTRLAFVSKTPGRTQAINFFELPRGGFAVDLPGYGFAKAAKHMQAGWGELLGRYVRERESLAALVLIMDMRHPLRDLDVAMLEWFGPAGKPVIALLTKADKLNIRERNAAVKATRQGLDELGWAGRSEVLMFSSSTRLGLDQTSGAVDALLGYNDPAPQTPDNV